MGGRRSQPGVYVAARLPRQHGGAAEVIFAAAWWGGGRNGLDEAAANERHKSAHGHETNERVLTLQHTRTNRVGANVSHALSQMAGSSPAADLLAAANSGLLNAFYTLARNATPADAARDISRQPKYENAARVSGCMHEGPVPANLTSSISQVQALLK